MSIKEKKRREYGNKFKSKESMESVWKEKARCFLPRFQSDMAVLWKLMNAIQSLDNSLEIISLFIVLLSDTLWEKKLKIFFYI